MKTDAIFSPLTVPLQGINLIEASAGTGKTFSIAALFLRVILANYPLESILVVTFTEAAAAELKNRVLRFLKEADSYLKNLDSANETEKIIREIVDNSLILKEKKELLKLLSNAIQNFDSAPISTIHGFCARTIKENAFELGGPFNLKLSDNMNKLVKESIVDFLREETTNPENQNGVLLSEKRLFSIDELQKLINNKIVCGVPLIYPSENLSEDSSVLREYVERLFRQVIENIKKNRDKTGELTFNDLLTIIDEKIKKEPNGSFVRAIQKKYRAVFIDEFQDTDPVQYNIFKTFFEKEGRIVFYIGDPKQSIYSFRNADVFTYLNVAKNENVKKYSMAINFRSSPNAVNAVNALFDSEGSFEIKEIKYEKILPKGGKEPNGLKYRGNFFYGLGIGLCSSGKAESEDSITGDMILKIGEMLKRDSLYSIEGRRVLPSDIAVLVANNREAAKIKKEFDKSGIPAVLTAKESVFKTKEAVATLILMEAVAGDRLAKLKALLLSIFYRKTVKEVLDFVEKGEDFNNWNSKLADFFVSWENFGFFASFSHFIKSDGVYENLASEGERALTNVRHLAELIHARESKEGFSVRATIKWFKEKMREESENENEEELIRLEKDADAVKILTIHKSKGLEFNIVFCPNLTRRRPSSKRRGSPWSYFHENGREFLTFDLKDKKIQAQIDRESVSESLRLLYTAVTRAKFFTMVYCGKSKFFQDSPLSKLLFNVSDSKAFKNLSDEFIYNRLIQIKQKSGKTIGLCKIDDRNWIDAARLELNPKEEKRLVPPKKFERKMEKERLVSSFTSISASKTTEKSFDFLAFLDEEGDETELTPIQEEAQTAPKDKKATIFDFPSGTASGTVLHSIFEKIDFAAQDNSEIIRNILSENSLLYDKDGLDMLPAVEECVKNVCDAPIFNKSSLRSLKSCDYASELEFYFPAKATNGRQLADIIGKNRMNSYDFNIEGFVRGFIDLIFKLDGKYYLVDWKSNNLGSDLSNYSKKNLEKEMAKRGYFLQYAIYLAALDRYLAKTDKTYAYQNNFGGVYYLFLRGISDKNNYGGGVYFDCPRESEIRRVQRLFFG